VEKHVVGELLPGHGLRAAGVDLLEQGPQLRVPPLRGEVLGAFAGEAAEQGIHELLLVQLHRLPLVVLELVL